MNGKDILRCKHCAAQIKHTISSSCNRSNANLQTVSHIETDYPMRCPNCMRRINNSTQEFIELLNTNRN